MRRLVVCTLLGAAVIGSFWIWHDRSQLRYERDRAVLEWQAAKLAEKVRSVGAIPNVWGAGLFLSGKGLAQAASTLKGMRITSETDDVVLTFDDLSIRSESSFAEVGIALSIHSTKTNAAFKAKAVAEVMFAGAVQKDEKSAVLRFGLVPIEIVPEIAWYEVGLRGSKLVSDLIVGELLAGMIGSAPFEIPVPNGFSADLGGDRTGTLPINKDLGSTLSYSLSLPPLPLKASLRALSPLFLKDGLWLLASDKVVDGLGAPPDPADRTHETLIRETREVRATLDGMAPPQGDAVLWIGSNLVLSTVNQIATLPPERRRAEFRSTKIAGQIAEKKWRDDLLGDGGAFAEFVDDNSVTGSAVVAQLTPKWIPGVGLDLQTQVDASAEAKVHAHVDPLIGGGVGTTIGLVGGASSRLGATVALAADTVDGTRVLVARAKGRCGSLDVSLKSDGKAKVDFGWTKVPSVGIIRHQPVDLSVVPPIALLDDLPRTIDARDADGKPRTADLKGRKVTIEPAWRYLSAKISVDGAEAAAGGWLVGTRIDIAAAQQAADMEASKAQQERIRSSLSQQSSSSCTDQGSTEVTIGDVAFGPNNEIVKFLVGVGKFTQEMADRIGHEVSTEKLREWAKDPKGSFERSDPGKAVNALKNVITAPIDNYCAHNWCP